MILRTTEGIVEEDGARRGAGVVPPEGVDAETAGGGAGVVEAETEGEEAAPETPATGGVEADEAEAEVDRREEDEEEETGVLPGDVRIRVEACGGVHRLLLLSLRLLTERRSVKMIDSIPERWRQEIITTLLPR